ncbi:MAG: insulinase family protein [Bacteroidota bacterium]
MKSSQVIFFFSFLFIVLVHSKLLGQDIKIEEYKLKNGLTIILHEDHSKPEVFGVVAVRAGGKNDPVDATGMAHYQEHMLFKGTQELGTTDWEKEKPIIEKIFSLYDQLGQTEDPEKRKEIQTQINEESLKASDYAIPNETSNLIKSIGGTNLNAGTGEDMTMYYNAFPPNQIEKWLELYSQRFINPVFRSFQAELEVVYEEKNLYNDMFIFPILEEFNKNFYKKHPYGQQTLIGTIDDLKNPSLTKMFEFYKTYYVANNMSLILVGDFNTDEVKPLIEKKFGIWRRGDIPEAKKYEETEFNGRELIERKMSPIKLGFLGFRTPANGHDDEVAMEVCNGILSNQNQTGLIDRLSLDNLLMAAQLLPMTYNDYGCTIVLIVPKILGQKLEDAEKLVLDEIENLKKGNFDDWLIDAIKMELYKNYQLSFESNEYKANILADAFGKNMSMTEVLNYPEKIQKITKEDVIRVANKYYGQNFLAFYSKMGFPKKQKIEKPGYEPLLANTNAKSKFTKEFDQIKSKDPVRNFIEFDKDIKTKELNKNCSIYIVPNSKNDIFSVTLKYGIGYEKLPLLKYAADIMNYSGTETFEVNDFKKEFSKIGCSYSISSDQSYLEIEIDGPEKNIGKAIELVTELLNKPKLNPEKLDLIVEGEKAGRKMEKSEPDNIADALFDYVRFADKSDYLDRLTLSEIKKLNTDSLTSTFLKATNYKLEIHACVKDIDTFYKIIKPNMTFNKKYETGDSPIVYNPEEYKENLIYFVDKPKALQSKIFFFMNGTEYSIKKEPEIDAFNLYFGGGFSGLVLQEIREYRSMAYSAGAYYRTPQIPGKNNSFIGYIGTQADKTNEAIDVFVGLVRKMPEKSERIEMIKPYLVQSALSNRPDMRDLSQTILNWKLKGYAEDPAKYKIKRYEKISFKNITDFYAENIKEKPMVICIVGNKKSIDLKSLGKYGEIIKLKENKLFND